ARCVLTPLQGDGMSQAMDSGRAAAQAILGGLDRAAGDYRAHLARTHGPHLSTAGTPPPSPLRPPDRLSPPASAPGALLRRPRLVAPFTRSLPAPAVGRPLAGAWSITWNDLLDGA